MPRTSAQLYMFKLGQSTGCSQNLMSTIDQFKSKIGRGSIKLASEGMNYSWKICSGRKSPNYTTSWDGIKIINL